MKCAEALDHREASGLPCEARWPLHLTLDSREGDRWLYGP
jgi:hypothetical protein